MSADLSLLAGRIRAELVGRESIPAPIHDSTADDAVRIAHSRGAGEQYLRLRLMLVVEHFERSMQASGLPWDARIALGEYETLLDLQSGVRS